jgi:hypothetical protein
VYKNKLVGSKKEKNCMSLLLNNLSNSKIQSFIIFIIVALIVIQIPILIDLFAINTPLQDEWDFVPYVVSYYDNGEFWEYKDFWQHLDHRQIIYSLLTIANVSLFSWNLIYQMFFAWGMLLSGLVLSYLILKKSLPKLKWIIILIAAFLFNTGQGATFLSSLASTASYGATAGIIASIYFLNKGELKRKTIIFAILCAWFASFSETHGLMIWVVGAFSLIFSKKKKYLLIWSINAIIVFTLFFTNFEFNTYADASGLQEKGFDITNIISLEGLEFVVLFLINGLFVNLQLLYPIYLIIGTIMILVIIGGPVYLHFKKIETKKWLPWFQLGLLGMLSAAITGTARLGENPMVTRWEAVAVLSQIAVLVLSAMILVHIYYNSINTKKRLVKVIFFTLIIFLSLGVVSSYISGWYLSDVYWNQASLMGLECMLKPNSDYICPFMFKPDDGRDRFEILATNAQMLKDREIGTFSKSNTSKIYSVNSLLEISNWKDIKKIEGINGSVDYIEQQSVISLKKIFVDKSSILIHISGWGVIDEKSPKIDSAYLFINNKINSELRHGLVEQGIISKYGVSAAFNAGWDGVIDLRTLESKKCHDISIRLVKEMKYYEIIGETKLCIK